MEVKENYVDHFFQILPADIRPVMQDLFGQIAAPAGRNVYRTWCVSATN